MSYDEFIMMTCPQRRDFSSTKEALIWHLNNNISDKIQGDNIDELADICLEALGNFWRNEENTAVRTPAGAPWKQKYSPSQWIYNYYRLYVMASFYREYAK